MENKKLYKAIADFQQEVPVIHKDTEGYGYTYADLPKIFEVINPLMKKHSLGFTQLVTVNELQQSILETTLFHAETGEEIKSRTMLPSLEYIQTTNKKGEPRSTIKGFEGMNEAQAMGSLITYFRRYALSAMLGLVTDKDTDASGEQVKKETPKAKTPAIDDLDL